MGRAIEHDNRLDGHDIRFEKHETRIKLIEDALEELVQTKVHHVDLHDELDKHESDIRNVVAEGTEVKPDEEFTPPAGKRKKTKSTKPEKVESML